MPLRDHFHAPLDDKHPWEAFHAQWPAMIVLALMRKLPKRYIAEPRVHPGGHLELDVSTFHEEEEASPSNGTGDNGEGGVATAVWAPPRCSLATAIAWPPTDAYEVRVYDNKRKRRLVAAVEIVSPSNKDRPESRAEFVGKCVALLREQVSVVIVDIVTAHHFNLYSDLLELLQATDPALSTEEPPLYASACRALQKPSEQGKKKGKLLEWQLESWHHVLPLGQPLPTLPLWLASDLALPLELEASYEETCRVFRIP